MRLDRHFKQKRRHVTANRAGALEDDAGCVVRRQRLRGPSDRMHVQVPTLSPSEDVLAHGGRVHGAYPQGPRLTGRPSGQQEASDCGEQEA